jgi:hypothetical protein
MMTVQTKEGHIKQELISQIISACTKVLESQGDIKVLNTIQSNQFLEYEDELYHSAMIKYASNHYDYSANMSFSQSILIKYLSNLLGEDVTETSSEIKELPLELANIILGETKRVLNEQKHNIQMARPQEGSNQINTHAEIYLYFHTNHGNFIITLA